MVRGVFGDSGNTFISGFFFLITVNKFFGETGGSVTECMANELEAQSGANTEPSYPEANRLSQFVVFCLSTT